MFCKAIIYIEKTKKCLADNSTDKYEACRTCRKSAPFGPTNFKNSDFGSNSRFQSLTLNILRKHKTFCFSSDMELQLLIA